MTNSLNANPDAKAFWRALSQIACGTRLMCTSLVSSRSVEQSIGGLLILSIHPFCQEKANGAALDQ
jgi:hypothetical protein